MTKKTEFSAEEWDLIAEGPPGAGFMVMTAQRGGTFRETFSIAKEYAEARKQHGASELLDEIVSSKPKADRTRHHSFEELKDHTLGELRDAVALLEQKATPDEVDDYRRFVIAVAERVAGAHEEHGQQVSEAESAALEEIKGAVGTAA